MSGTANLCTQMLYFRGFCFKQHLNIQGRNSHVHREFPGKLEASNLSREILSREIGCSAAARTQALMTSNQRKQ